VVEAACIASQEGRAQPGRHLPPCPGTDCAGCLPCPHDHCWDCGWRHTDDQHPVTCPRCTGKVRQCLADIAALVAALHADLIYHANDAMPGGNLLVLLGWGSEGAFWAGEQRLQPTYRCGLCDTGGLLEPARHLLEVHMSTDWHIETQTFALDGGQAAANTANDNLPSDPPSILFALQRVEDDWRSKLGHVAAQQPYTIAASVRYMEAHLTWAEQRWDGFPDFAREMRQHRARLRNEEGDADPTITGVKCLNLDCEGDLQALFAVADPCDHDGCPGCDQGGRRDYWTCDTCGREYPDAEYRRAVAQAHEDLSPYRTAGEIQQTLGVRPGTLRQWVHRGYITAQPSDRRGRAKYDLHEVRRWAMRGGLLAEAG
jgi:hypothetical protein